MTLGAGTLFGTALWIGADEVAVPGSGPDEPAGPPPPPMHAAAWSVHLVYGEVGRRILR